MRTALSRSLFLICMLLPAATGCTGAGVFRKTEVVRATPADPAVEIVGVWQPARGRGLNSLPARGIAGQLMFFTRSDALPAVVDGSVRVYLFDNKGTREEQAVPIHQFDFPADDWQRFLQGGNLGPSYHVFIPYVRGGHDQVDCSVLVRFTPADGGPVIYSDMTTVTLPGKVDEAPVAPISEFVNRPESGLTVRNISSAELRTDPQDGRLTATRSVIHAHAADDHGPRTGTVQPAGSITTGASRPDPRGARIQELEQLVAELTAAQRGEPQPLPAATAEAAPIPVPAASAQDGPDRRRFRMSAAPSADGARSDASASHAETFAPAAPNEPQSPVWWNADGSGSAVGTGYN